MTNRLPRLLLLTAVSLVAALTLVACGGATQPSTHGDSEGAYVQAGPLIYQVQLSRQLNPANVEDVQYLQGLPADTPPLADDELWFGVWMRVQNATNGTHPLASGYRIIDTTGVTYEPIALPATNAFSYQPIDVQGGDVQPDPESAAGTGPIQGTMLLFKLRTDSFASRPLELEITPPDGGEPSSVVLDL